MKNKTIKILTKIDDVGKRLVSVWKDIQIKIANHLILKI